MAPDHLLHDALRHVVHVERPLLGRHLRVEHHLEEHVPELVAKPVRVAGIDRVQHLVGLLQQVSGQRAVGLFVVPGASARAAEPGHDPDQVEQPLALPARRDGALGNRGQRIAGGPAGHGEAAAVGELEGVGELDGVGDPVAVLLMGSTFPVEGSNRPYFGFTVMSRLPSCSCSQSVNAFARSGPANRSRTCSNGCTSTLTSWMMCHPNSVWIGSLIWPGLSARAARTNVALSPDAWRVPRSPPFGADPESIEFCSASRPKFCAVTCCSM